MEDRLGAWQKRREKKRLAQQERAHGESAVLDSECTFQPKISVKARSMASAGRGAHEISEEQALAVLLRAVQSRHGAHRLMQELQVRSTHTHTHTHTHKMLLTSYLTLLTPKNITVRFRF